MKKATTKARKNRGKKAQARRDRQKMISKSEFDKAKRIAMSNFVRLGKAGRIKLYSHMQRQLKQAGRELLDTDLSSRASYLMGKIHAHKELLEQFQLWFKIPIKAHFDVAVIIQEGELNE